MLKMIYILFISSAIFIQGQIKHVYFIADTTVKTSPSHIYASPEIGWKEFCKRITYPLKSIANNIETSFGISIQIDSTGNINNVNNYGESNSSEFFKSMYSLIMSQKWNPAVSGGKKRNSIDIPIIFYIKHFDNPFPMVISGKRLTIQHTISYEKDEKGNGISNTTLDTTSGKKDSVYFIGNIYHDCPGFTSPSPAEGFETLKTMADNQLYQRAGFSASKVLKLHFKNTGEIDSAYYTPYMRVLVDSLNNRLQKIKWNPAKENNRNVKSSLSIPLVYYIRDDRDVYPIIVEVVKCGN